MVVAPPAKQLGVPLPPPPLLLLLLLQIVISQSKALYGQCVTNRLTGWADWLQQADCGQSPGLATDAGCWTRTSAMIAVDHRLL